MRILILGAQGGIGKEVLNIFAVNLHDVIALSREECDVTYGPIVESIFKTYAPEVVINCAGKYSKATLLNTDEVEFDKICNVNFKGAFFIMKYAIKYHCKTIINFSSIMGLKGYGLANVYAGTKAAIIGLHNSCVKTYPQHRFFTICPRMVDTPMFRQDNPDVPKQLVTSPKEVAKKVYSLLKRKKSAVIKI